MRKALPIIIILILSVSFVFGFQKNGSGLDMNSSPKGFGNHGFNFSGNISNDGKFNNSDFRIYIEHEMSNITKNHLFKRLILNKPRHAEFEIRNPFPSNISSEIEPRFNLSFTSKCGGIRHYRLLYNTTCTKEVIDHYIYKNEYSCWQDPDNKTVCGTRKVIDKTIYKNITYSCWKPVDNIKGLSSHKIKIEVKPQDIIWGKCSDGTYGYKVDWIPQLQLSDKFGKKRLFKMDEWAWWNSTFTKAKNITINNTAGALTDYQLRLNITYDSDMQADFDDIRFTWYNSTLGLEQQIPYWLQEKADSSWAVVWIKIPELPNSNNINTVKMYYGNPSATSESNGEDVFLFFDDFEDGDYTDKWYSGISGWSESGGILTNSNTGTGWKTLKLTAYSTPSTGKYAIAYKVKLASDDYLATALYYTDNNNHVQSYHRFHEDIGRINDRYSGTNHNYDSGTISMDGSVWNTVETKTPSPNEITQTINDELIQTVTISGNNNGTTVEVWLGYYVGGSIDDFRIRQYVEPEPTYSLSSEWSETTPDNVNYTQSVSDSFSFSNPFSKSALFSKSVEDSAFLFNASSLTLGKFRGVSDSASFSSVLNSRLSYTEQVTDSASLNSGANSVFFFIKSVFDYSSFNQDLGRLFGFYRSLDSSASLSDAQTKSSGFRVELSDTYSLSSGLTSIFGTLRALTDTISTTSSISDNYKYTKVLSSVLSLFTGTNMPDDSTDPSQVVGGGSDSFYYNFALSLLNGSVNNNTNATYLGAVPTFVRDDTFKVLFMILISAVGSFLIVSLIWYIKERRNQKNFKFRYKLPSINNKI